MRDSFGRFILLLGLRLKLTLRASGQSPGRMVAFLFGWAIFLVMALGTAWITAGQVRATPSLLPEMVRLVFVSTFVAQVLFGLMSLAASEFFDVSRLMHLPVREREVFSAMVASGLVSPMALFYGAPALGIVVGAGGGASIILCRVAIVVLLLLLGHAFALLFNLWLLLAFTRRRLRDLVTIFASILGTGVFIAIRSFDSQGFQRLVEADPAARLWFFPSQWLARLFLLDISPGLASLLGFGVLSVFTFTFALGARALRASYLGQVPSPETKAIGGDETRAWRWLPRDLAALVESGRHVYWREPHVKGLYLQQTVFLVLPFAFIQFQSMKRGNPLPSLAYALPGLLAMSHLAFAQSLFGLDGRGITLQLLSPLPRWKLLLGRGIALLSIFVVFDAILAAILLVTSGVMRGDWRAHLDQFPFVLIAVLIADLVVVSLGNIVSVVAPTRLFTPGRRAIQGQRMENAGCAAQATRGFLFLPAILMGAILVGLALLPRLRWFSGSRILPDSALWVTIPLGIGLAGGIYALTVFLMGRSLERREERLAAALIDSGD